MKPCAGSAADGVEIGRVGVEHCHAVFAGFQVAGHRTSGWRRPRGRRRSLPGPPRSCRDGQNPRKRNRRCPGVPLRNNMRILVIVRLMLSVRHSTITGTLVRRKPFVGLLRVVHHFVQQAGALLDALDGIPGHGGLLGLIHYHAGGNSCPGRRRRARRP